MSKAPNKYWWINKDVRLKSIFFFQCDKIFFNDLQNKDFEVWVPYALA